MTQYDILGIGKLMPTFRTKGTALSQVVFLLPSAEKRQPTVGHFSVTSFCFICDYTDEDFLFPFQFF